MLGSARQTNEAGRRQIEKRGLARGLKGTELGHRGSVDRDHDPLSGAGTPHNRGDLISKFSDTDRFHRLRVAHAYTA